MTYEAYISNIYAKTGLTPEDFQRIAATKGLERIGQAIKWLKSEYNLGHGHANTIAHIIINPGARDVPAEQKLDLQFASTRRKWRPQYEELAALVLRFGDDVSVVPTRSYISLLRSGTRFGLVQVTSGRQLDVGLKLKGVAPTGGLEFAGTWSSMVTHRIRIRSPAKLLEEVMPWLSMAYALAE
jgi:hypothetical protein